MSRTSQETQNPKQADPKTQSKVSKAINLISGKLRSDRENASKQAINPKPYKHTIMTWKCANSQ